MLFRSPPAVPFTFCAAGEISIGAQKVTGTAGGGIALSDLWPYALAAALVILTLEWWVYHRRHWIRRDAASQRVRPLGPGPGGDGAPIIRA